MAEKSFPPQLSPTTPYPLGLSFQKAQGTYLYDEKGDAWLDLIAGVGVNNVGHCHPKVVKVIKEQSEKYLHQMVYGEYIQTPQTRLAEKLTSLLPSALDQVYFVNSGTEANEAALKLAKRVTGRSELIAFKGSYHGSTHGSLSVSWGEERKRNFRPLLPDVRFLNFNDEQALEQITEKTAGVIIEPIQGDAGVRIPNKSFMQRLRERCDETCTLLILDEIQTGFGRTGKMFALEHFDITPDVITMAKALGSGMPLGALAAPGKLLEQFTYDPVLGHINTFGGNPVCCAAALAGLEVQEEERLPEAAARKGEKLKSILDKEKILEVRQIGLMIAVELEGPEQVQKVVERAREHNLLLFWFLSAPHAFRIAPPLNIPDEEVERAGVVLVEILNQA